MSAVIPAAAAATKSDELVSPPGVVDQLDDCNAVDCDDDLQSTAGDAAAALDCPHDSLPAPSRHDSSRHHLPDSVDTGDGGGGGGGGLCCERRRRPLVCQCLPCDDAVVCGAQQVRVLVDEGRDTPGHCCDVYECLDRG